MGRFRTRTGNDVTGYWTCSGVSWWWRELVSCFRQALGEWCQTTPGTSTNTQTVRFLPYVITRADQSRAWSRPSLRSRGRVGQQSRPWKVKLGRRDVGAKTIRGTLGTDIIHFADRWTLLLLHFGCQVFSADKWNIRETRSLREVQLSSRYNSDVI